jgi:Transglutaminase-like superfamily
MKSVEVTEQTQSFLNVSKRQKSGGLSGWGLAAAKLLLRNPRFIKKLLVLDPDEPRYVRPPREYELPTYRQGTKYCKSDEKYLRPTPWCNPRERLVIALANELGAYEKTDREFAEAALNFIDNNLTLELCPFDSVGVTLKRGTGSCWHLINVFIALCRAAGIKARGKVFEQVMTEEEQNVLMGSDPVFWEIYSAITVFSQGEVFVDGVWLDADVAASPETHAARGMPITKLGEGHMGTQRGVDPSQVWHTESVPPFVVRGMTMLKWFAPAARERMNVTFQQQNALGRRIIEEAGGIEAYDRKVRRREKLLSGEEIVEEITRFAEEAKRKQFLVFEK